MGSLVYVVVPGSNNGGAEPSCCSWRSRLTESYRHIRVGLQVLDWSRVITADGRSLPLLVGKSIRRLFVLIGAQNGPVLGRSFALMCVDLKPTGARC